MVVVTDEFVDGGAVVVGVTVDQMVVTMNELLEGGAVVSAAPPSAGGGACSVGGG
jgi:hypothetical protein